MQQLEGINIIFLDKNNNVSSLIGKMREFSKVLKPRRSTQMPRTGRIANPEFYPSVQSYSKLDQLLATTYSYLHFSSILLPTKISCNRPPCAKRDREAKFTSQHFSVKNFLQGTFIRFRPFLEERKLLFDSEFGLHMKKTDAVQQHQRTMASVQTQQKRFYVSMDVIFVPEETKKDVIAR